MVSVLQRKGSISREIEGACPTKSKKCRPKMTRGGVKAFHLAGMLL